MRRQPSGWVRAQIRGQSVYARADEYGDLWVRGRRVEIRYKPFDGKFYSAKAKNLVVVDQTLLPEATCGPAERAPKRRRKRRKKRADVSLTPSPSRLRQTPHIADVEVYTDGSYGSNNGVMGMGVVFVARD